MDADERMVLAGVSIGVAMLAVWIAFIIIFLLTEGPEGFHH
jgi:hypothetical protein